MKLIFLSFAILVLYIQAVECIWPGIAAYGDAPQKLRLFTKLREMRQLAKDSNADKKATDYFHESYVDEIAPTYEDLRNNDLRFKIGKF